MRGQAGLRAEVVAYTRCVADSLRDRTLAILILGGFAVFLVRNGVLALVPLYAVQGFGGNTVVAGMLLSLMEMARVVASPLSGHLLATTSRRLAFVGTLGLVSASMLLLVVAPSIRWLGVDVAAYGVGMALFNPMLNAAVLAGATIESRAGVVSSMMVFKNAANAAGFTFLAVTAGFDIAFGVAAAVGIGYVALVVVGLEDEI